MTRFEDAPRVVEYLRQLQPRLRAAPHGDQPLDPLEPAVRDMGVVAP
ncbi:hypothetical protein SNARM312S_02815 [Streptomyces narbonensis]